MVTCASDSIQMGCVRNFHRPFWNSNRAKKQHAARRECVAQCLLRAEAKETTMDLRLTL